MIGKNDLSNLQSTDSFSEQAIIIKFYLIIIAFGGPQGCHLGPLFYCTSII